jgi:hypothetical protein
MNTDDFKNEEEFDLYVKGAWDERKRIIAIIVHADTVIALIKGENE